MILYQQQKQEQQSRKEEYTRFLKKEITKNEYVTVGMFVFFL